MLCGVNYLASMHIIAYLYTWLAIAMCQHIYFYNCIYAGGC